MDQLNEAKNVGDENAGTIGSIRAALWDAHYGKGLSAEYARAADADLDALAANVKARERLLNISLDLLIDIYASRAGQRFSAIGLSRIKSHIADLRAELTPANESAQRPGSTHPAHGQASKTEVQK